MAKKSLAADRVVSSDEYASEEASIRMFGRPGVLRSLPEGLSVEDLSRGSPDPVDADQVRQHVELLAGLGPEEGQSADVAPALPAAVEHAPGPDPFYFSDVVLDKSSFSTDYTTPAPVRTESSLPIPFAPVPTVQPAVSGPTSMEQLGLPFLTFPPSPPKQQVMFDLGPLGHLRAFFHSVSVSDECVLLMYDSRYEGSQFLPPNTSTDSPPVKLTLNLPTGAKVYFVIIPPWYLQFGCVDVVQCLICDFEQESSPDFDEELDYAGETRNFRTRGHA